MTVRVWNAFASNNSGSYTIVGSFATRELASEVAAELTEAVKAHAAWLEAEMAKQKYPLEGEPPLAAFVKQHGLTGYDRIGTSDDWPMDGADMPSVLAVDQKVILHHGYTVTMPSAIGAYFYARGGRVDHELNHAHHPIVAVFELWVPWNERKGVDVPAKVASIVAALSADDGPLVTLAVPWHEPAWQSKEGFGEADLTVGAIFDDLAEGFGAVHRIACAHGLRTSVKVFEMFAGADPLAFLRPSLPALPDRLCSVVIDGNASGDAFVRALGPLVHHDQAEINRVVAATPYTLRTGLARARAERLASVLREAGGTVSVKPEPRRV
jgi:hypothetical protein